MGANFLVTSYTTGTRGHLSRTTQIAVSPQRPNSRTGEPTPGTKRKKNASDQSHAHAALAVELLDESIGHE